MIKTYICLTRFKDSFTHIVTYHIMHSDVMYDNNYVWSISFLPCWGQLLCS